MQVEQDIFLKLLLLETHSVLKSALLLKCSENLFNESYHATIGLDFKIKRMNLNGKSIKLLIWDTAGQERCQNLISTYFEGVKGILIIDDVTCKESFNYTLKCLVQIEKHKKSDIFKILVGNKSDLNNQREVTVEEGQKLANDSGMLFIEISAKEGFNVEHAFNNLIDQVLAESEKIQILQIFTI